MKQLSSISRISGAEVPPIAGLSSWDTNKDDHDFAMYILQARILSEKTITLTYSSDTSKVFRKRSTHLPPETGVRLSDFHFFSEVS